MRADSDRRSGPHGLATLAAIAARKRKPVLDIEIKAAEALAHDDASSGREPLWYRVGESYISAETGHIGNDELGAAYVRAYAAAKDASGRGE